MYVVIFRAKVAELDPRYLETAKRMRTLAIEKYGCREFESVCEGDMEISLSYWDSEQDIVAWKKDAEHLVAQALGQQQWYKNYRVEVAKIERAYSYGDAGPLES